MTDTTTGVSTASAGGTAADSTDAAGPLCVSEPGNPVCARRMIAVGKLVNGERLSSGGFVALCNRSNCATDGRRVTTLCQALGTTGHEFKSSPDRPKYRSGQ